MEMTAGIKPKTWNQYNLFSCEKRFLHANAPKSVVWEHDVSSPVAPFLNFGTLGNKYHNLQQVFLE